MECLQRNATKCDVWLPAAPAAFSASSVVAEWPSSVAAVRGSRSGSAAAGSRSPPGGATGGGGGGGAAPQSSQGSSGQRAARVSASTAATRGCRPRRIASKAARAIAGLP